MRTGTFAPVVDPSLYPPGGAALLTDAEATALGARMRDLLAGSAVRPSAAASDYDVFIQELTRPVEQASVQITGKLAVAMALSQGKVVHVASASTLPETLMLQAPSIDTIVVYVAGPELIRICAYLRLTDVKPGSPDLWDQAPYLVKGLTLPIVEADPALTTSALEYAAATGRLLAGETLTLRGSKT